MITDSLQVIHVIFLSILFGLLLCFAILVFLLLSFRTIICKLNVLSLTFFLKIYLNILLMQSYYKIFVHLEFVVPDGFMYAYCHF
jgi:hypothetical protein